MPRLPFTPELTRFASFLVLAMAAPAMLSAHRGDPPKTAGKAGKAQDDPFPNVPKGEKWTPDMVHAYKQYLNQWVKRPKRGEKKLLRTFGDHDAFTLKATKLRVSGNATDQPLLTFIRGHAQVQYVELRDAPGVTPDGLLAALLAAPRLDTLKVMGGVLQMDSVLQGIGPRLKELDLDPGDRGLTSVSDAGLRACTRLKSLSLNRMHEVTGAGLAVSLERLEVADCEKLSPTNLPTGLSHLELTSQLFPVKPFPIRPALKSLKLDFEFGFNSADLLQMLAGNRTLTSLDVAIPMAAKRFTGMPPQLKELAISPRGARAMVDFLQCDFDRCTQLVKLKLANYQGQLDGALPAGLRDLELNGCQYFQGTSPLPAGLQSLTVAFCPRFTLGHLGEGIKDLELVACRELAPAQVAEALGRMPNLLKLDYVASTALRSADLDPLQAAISSHPKLQRAQVGDKFGENTRIKWARRSAGNDAPDPAPASAAPAVPRVRYTVPPPPAVGPEARIEPERTTLRARQSLLLTARTATGSQPDWAWEASAGTVETAGLPRGQARFTPPADAAPGSVFRITLRATSSSSTAPAPLRTFLDLTLR